MSAADRPVDRIPFTKSGLSELKSKRAAYAVYDRGHRDSVPGLLIRVLPGGAKTFQVYRKVKGRPVRVGLGRFPAVTVEQARRRAIQELAKLTEGINPNEEKRRSREESSTTLRKVLDDYCRDRRLRPNTEAGYRGALNKYLPEYLDQPLEMVTRDVVMCVHQAIASPTAANKVMRVLRALFEYAAGEYLNTDGTTRFPDNPVRQLSHKRVWHPERSRTARITAYQLPAWFDAVNRLEAPWRDYFFLVLLTGLRRREAQGLAWTEVDLRDRTITVPPERTKNAHLHILPIPAFLLEMLTARRSDSPWVFPSATSASGHIENPAKAIAHVRKESGISFTVHDLRRTFASVAEEVGISGYLLKRLLNHHVRTDVTQSYVEIPVTQLREPMQRIETAIREAAKTTAQSLEDG